MLPPTRISDLTADLQKELRALGRKLGMDVRLETPLSFFDTENIRDKQLQQRAEKALKKAEKQVLSMAALHLHVRAPSKRMAETAGAIERERSHETHLQIEPHAQTIRERVVSKLMLTREQSLRLLVEGNRAFVAEWGARKKTPTASEKYDALLLVCADPRAEPTDLNLFKDRRVLVVQIAGNVGGKYLRSALPRLKDGGEIIVCGHTNCGACDHAATPLGGRSSKSLRHLVEHIDLRSSGGITGDIYRFNASNQARMLRESKLVRRKNISVTAVMLDPTDRQNPLQLLESGKPSLLVSALQSSAIQQVTASEREGKEVGTPYAHAVVLARSQVLGTVSNSRLVLGAGMNELFSVAVPGSALTAEAVASIEFALLHIKCIRENGHLVIMDSDIDRARDQLNTLLRASDVVRSKTQNGKTVTLGRFNPDTGEVSFVS